MLNIEDTILYIGKAKNLKKRLINYTNPTKMNARLQNLVANIKEIKIILTEK